MSGLKIKIDRRSAASIVIEASPEERWQTDFDYACKWEALTDSASVRETAKAPTAGETQNAAAEVTWPFGQPVSVRISIYKKAHAVSGYPTDPEWTEVVYIPQLEFSPMRATREFADSDESPKDPQDVRVTMGPADVGASLEDVSLWKAIRSISTELSFDAYAKFLAGDAALKSHFVGGQQICDGIVGLSKSHGIEPYRFLKAATEAFVMTTCALRNDLGGCCAKLKPSDGKDEINVLVYLSIIRQRLPELPIVNITSKQAADCWGIVQERLEKPCMVELIWSYWHEEAMLAQAMNAISRRFQNRSISGRRDPLANLEIDPLQPLSNLMWGYIQNEIHRLPIARRAHEYLHQYGFTLHGKAVGELRPADTRSKFLEAFHNLLYQCILFYRQSNDTTIMPDGFPVLNSLKETHYLLAQGAHNQFGDLPTTARQEMLIEQWLMARPEMRSFLGTRIMVPYPEPWMDRVDSVKSLYGWTDSSVVHFNELAVYGEQVLLSIRYGAWSKVDDRQRAATWAREFRNQIQGYVHAYRSVTGVDLNADITDNQQLASRFLPPSTHLVKRLQAQAG